MTDSEKVDCLVAEIQELYILMKEKAKDSRCSSETFSQCEKQNDAIRNMKIFMLLQYLRSAVELILESPYHGPLDNIQQPTAKASTVQTEGCPPVYEKMICDLEAKVREHVKFE